MADGRRHSIDVPISRTLVALRRVRSLRDPCTNSMSKFASLVENVKWETNSSNGISLRFANGEEEGSANLNGGLSARDEELNIKREGQDAAPEDSDDKLISPESLHGTENRFDGLACNNDEKPLGNNAPSSNMGFVECKDTEMGLVCVMPSINPVEGVDSLNSPVARHSPEKINGDSDSVRSSRSRTRRTSVAPVFDTASRVNSPMPSITGGYSNRTTSLFLGENDSVDLSNRGCALSCCWSTTPKLRGSNTSSDIEDHPLLIQDTGGSSPSGRGCWKLTNSDVTPISGTPRSLNQKFRPRSFDELVGQDIVAKSLMSAISRGRITSLYLFHGPRGTGKTSTSRIFAAALNCLSLSDNKPCGFCRECVSFFSGRTRDVIEIDPVKINRTNRLRSLIKSALTPPVSSRFKILIIDECQLLRGETWSTLLNSFDHFSQHAVLVMISPDLDKVPRAVVSRSQKFHFPKIRDSDITRRLEKICVEEGIEFDSTALEFIASKSNGSLRDAEITVDQLSLLGKKITLALAYDLSGVVSDDELLDLLDLALSCDTSNTVLRSRELMRSKIDPMQLITQLANLIMDILGGKCQESTPEVRRKFFAKHSSEEELQKLNHALKILSDTEKHLRAVKNQTTWLTVALLQLSTVDASIATNDSRMRLRSPKVVDFCSTSSEGESLKHLVPCSCDASETHKKEDHGEDRSRTLETIWNRVADLCHSASFKSFLQKHGKLSSLCVNQGLAIVELEFRHPHYVSKAEKSWKLIAASFQSVLGCNVEIRINLVLCSAVSKKAKARKLLFGLFNCSRRIHRNSRSTGEQRSDSEHSDSTLDMPIIMDRRDSTCSTNSCHRTELTSALRNSQGNVLSAVMSSSNRSIQDGSNTPYYVSTTCRPHNFRSSDASHTCLSSRQENRISLSIDNTASARRSVCGDDPHVFLPGSENYDRGCRDDNGLEDNSDVLCWRTPVLPGSKAWRETNQSRSSRVIECVLPCAAAK